MSRRLADKSHVTTSARLRILSNPCPIRLDELTLPLIISNHNNCQIFGQETHLSFSTLTKTVKKRQVKKTEDVLTRRNSVFSHESNIFAPLRHESICLTCRPEIDIFEPKSRLLTQYQDGSGHHKLWKSTPPLSLFTIIERFWNKSSESPWLSVKI